jgi:hypothetical protein
MNREENIKTRSSLIRTGLGIRAPFKSDLYKSNEGIAYPLNVDIFIYRIRDTNSNGLDFFARYGYNNYKSGSISENSSFVYDRLGINGFTPNIRITSIKWDHNIFGGGMRYLYGFYMWDVLCQGYAIAYYQFSWIKMNISGSNSLEKYYSYYSHGLAAGAGFEFGISSHLGLFAEYTYGYNQSFPSKINSERGTARFGATFRVSNLL